MDRWEPGPFEATLAVCEVHVWRLRISPEAVGVAVLSPEERARAERFRFERDRVQFAATRTALRILLARYLGSDPAALSFDSGPSGKPCLAAPLGARLHFNTSHSGDVALLAFALDAEVGTDVEQHRERMEVDALAPHACTARERAALQALDPEARRRAFFGLWAGKESILKALGSGFTISPHRVELLPLPWAAPCRVGVEGISDRFHALPLEVGPGFSGALACAGVDPRLRRYDVDVDALRRRS